MMTAVHRPPGLGAIGTTVANLGATRAADIVAVAQTGASTTAIADVGAGLPNISQVQALQVDYNKTITDVAALVVAVNALRAVLDTYNMTA